MKKIACIMVASLSLAQLHAQNVRELKSRVSLLFGLNQLMIDGYNIEGNIFYKRLAFDYSHGMSLNFDNSLLTGDAKDQGLAVHLPYSTGFGIGYRFNDWFNVRAEPKWHKFEIYYDGDAQNSANRISKYNTFTLGLGAYINWLPFKSKDNFLRGVTIAPSIRWWPNVSDSIDGSFTYNNTVTGQEEVHKAMNIGFGNTPIIVNVSVGYSLSF